MTACPPTILVGDTDDEWFDTDDDDDDTDLVVDTIDVPHEQDNLLSGLLEQIIILFVKTFY